MQNALRQLLILPDAWRQPCHEIVVAAVVQARTLEPKRCIAVSLKRSATKDTQKRHMSATWNVDILCSAVRDPRKDMGWEYFDDNSDEKPND